MDEKMTSTEKMKAIGKLARVAVIALATVLIAIAFFTMLMAIPWAAIVVSPTTAVIAIVVMGGLTLAAYSLWWVSE